MIAPVVPVLILGTVAAVFDVAVLAVALRVAWSSRPVLVALVLWTGVVGVSAAGALALGIATGVDTDALIAAGVVAVGSRYAELILLMAVWQHAARARLR